MKTGFLSALLLLVLLPGARIHADVAPGRHDANPAELTHWLRAHPEDSDARFLLARQLGWTGQYDAALAEYEVLLDAAPDNVDYLLGRSQVLVWMGRPQEALPILSRARTLAPGYEELWRLELNARIAASDPDAGRQIVAFADQARTRFPDAEWARYEPPGRARLESGFIYDNLTDGYRSWKELYVGGDYRLSNRLSLFGQARATERFGQSDEELRAGVSLSAGERWLFTFDGSITPQAEVLPEWSLSGRAARTLPRGFGVELGWRHAEYTLSSLDLMTAAGEYWFRRYRAGYTLYAASIDGGPLIYSHRGQIDRFYGDGSRVSLIASNGEEVESIGSGFFVVNEVQTLTLTGQHWLNGRWALTWELGQAWTTLYDKQRLRAGFTRQF